MWEGLTYGETPYSKVVHKDLHSFLASGGQLEVPALCPSRLVDTLVLCWAYEQAQRPSFTAILQALLSSYGDCISSVSSC